VQLSKQLQEHAMALSNAAGSGTDENLKEKAQKVFATCKSCHDQFRRPKDQEKGK
jgi:cytochrome c556